MTESTGTTRPTRRTAAKPATPKTTAKTPAKPRTASKPPVAPKAAPDVPEKFTVDLLPAGETASYAKFAFPTDMKGVAVGNVYAPHGTTAVKVLFVRDGDTTPEAPAE